MKTILVVLSVCLWHAATAKNYYISSSSGDDSRTSAQASNPSTPWKSLNKLNSFFDNIKPGDSILFKRGDVFFGSVKVTASGSSKAPIVLGAYGNGAKPVISGFHTLSNWESVGGGIWECSVPVSNLPSINMLTINDVQYAMGRYPNAKTANKGYMDIDAHAGSRSITSNALNASTDWTGGTVVVRTNHWVLDTCRITAHTAKNIKFSPATTYEPINGYGFFIQNHVKTLDQHGEWYYNSKTKKMRMFLNGNPNSYSIKISTVNTLISCYDVDYITLSNLRITGANKIGTYHYSAVGNSIFNCDIVFIGDVAVSSAQNDNVNFKAENNYISDAGNFGIDCRFSGNNQVIRNNVIKNIGLFAGMGGVGTQLRTGFANNTGKNHIIENNIFDSIGYAGLKFGGDYTIVKNNVVSNFTLVVDDGAGIYTANQKSGPKKGRRVIDNIVFNGPGAKEGTTNSSLGASSGIYADDNSSGIEISGNSVWNCGKAGLYIHNCNDLNIRNNFFYDNDQAQIELVHDNAEYTPLRNITFKNNISFSKTVYQDAAFFYTRLDDIVNFGAIDSNYYARPLDDNKTIIETTGLYTKNSASGSYSVQNWKARYGKDKASQKSPKSYPGNIKLDDSIRFEYNAGPSEKTIALDGNYIDVKNNKYSNTVTIRGFSSILLFRVGGATNKSPVVTITSPANNTGYEPPASVVIEATATDPDGTVTRVDFYNGNNYLGSDNTSPYSFTWNDVPEGHYTLTATAVDNGSLVTTSKAVNISVVSKKTAPFISIITPVNNATYISPAAVVMDVNAEDTDGTITKVEFYVGTTLIATDNTKPYSFTWNGAYQGTYAVSAKATDNDGLETISAEVHFTVLNPQAPKVSITSPVNNSYYVSGTDIPLIATATDSDGSILNVEFYIGETLLATITRSPYTFTWNDVPAGEYVITAKATDNDGYVTTSPDIFISVSDPETPEEPLPEPEPEVPSDTTTTEIPAPDPGNGVQISLPDVPMTDFHVRPNPAVNNVSVAYEWPDKNQDLKIYVLSTSGTILSSTSTKTARNIIPVDISSLKTGAYILQAVTKDAIFSKIFVKL